MKEHTHCLFYRLIKEGKLLLSGLDKDYNSYRVFEFQNKKVRLTLTKEENK